MATFTQYDQYYPTLNNGIGALADAVTISFQTDNKDVDIETIFKDFCGISPSPLKTTAKLDLHDPVSGSILGKLQKLEQDRTEVVLKIQKRGTTEQMEFAGFIRNVAGSSGVGDPSKITFEIHGKPARFQ